MALQTQKFARTEISAQISAIRNRQNQVFKKRKSRFSFLTLRVPGNRRPYRDSAGQPASLPHRNEEIRKVPMAQLLVSVLLVFFLGCCRLTQIGDQIGHILRFKLFSQVGRHQRDIGHFDLVDVAAKYDLVQSVFFLQRQTRFRLGVQNSGGDRSTIGDDDARAELRIDLSTWFQNVPQDFRIGFKVDTAQPRPDVITVHINSVAVSTGSGVDQSPMGRVSVAGKGPMKGEHPRRHVRLCRRNDLVLDRQFGRSEFDRRRPVFRQTFGLSGRAMASNEPGGPQHR